MAKLGEKSWKVWSSFFQLLDSKYEGDADDVYMDIAGGRILILPWLLNS